MCWSLPCSSLQIPSYHPLTVSFACIPVPMLCKRRLHFPMRTLVFAQPHLPTVSSKADQTLILKPAYPSASCLPAKKLSQTFHLCQHQQLVHEPPPPLLADDSNCIGSCQKPSILPLRSRLMVGRPQEESTAVAANRMTRRHLMAGLQLQRKSPAEGRPTNPFDDIHPCPYPVSQTDPA